MSFVNSEAIERSTVKYSEIVNQLIKAETLNDAKIILKNYDAYDQSILYDRLLERQKLWFAEHGLYDKFALGRGPSKAAQYFFGAISIGSFSFLGLVVHLLCKSGPRYKNGADTAIRLAITGVISGLFSLAATYENPIAKKQMKEFQRIKELLACVG